MKSVTADKSKRAAGGYLPTPRQGRRTLTSASETDSLFNRGRTQSLCKWRRPCESAAGKDRQSPVVFAGGANTSVRCLLHFQRMGAVRGVFARARPVTAKPEARSSAEATDRNRR